MYATQHSRIDVKLTYTELTYFDLQFAVVVGEVLAVVTEEEELDTFLHVAE